MSTLRRSSNVRALTPLAEARSGGEMPGTFNCYGASNRQVRRSTAAWIETGVLAMNVRSWLGDAGLAVLLALPTATLAAPTAYTHHARPYQHSMFSLPWQIGPRRSPAWPARLSRQRSQPAAANAAQTTRSSRPTQRRRAAPRRSLPSISPQLCIAIIPAEPDRALYRRYQHVPFGGPAALWRGAPAASPATGDARSAHPGGLGFSTAPWSSGIVAGLAKTCIK